MVPVDSDQYELTSAPEVRAGKGVGTLGTYMAVQQYSERQTRFTLQLQGNLLEQNLVPDPRYRIQKRHATQSACTFAILKAEEPPARLCMKVSIIVIAQTSNLVDPQVRLCRLLPFVNIGSMVACGG